MPEEKAPDKEWEYTTKISRTFNNKFILTSSTILENYPILFTLILNSQLIN